MIDRAPPAKGETAAKADPETLALRARPPRAIRFRRAAIAGIAACGAASLAMVSWVAFKPASFRVVVSPDERIEPNAARQPDVLADAPRSYAQVPKLGPPLPGDLGRPIIGRQRRIEASVDGDPAAAAGRRQAERDRRAAERIAARQAPLLVQLAPTGVGLPWPSPAGPAGLGMENSTPALAAPAAAESVAAGDDRCPSTDEGKTVSLHRLSPAPSPWTVSAGSVIAASLITGLNSDLPGLVVAQVTQNVFDSATGRTLLIPQGSRLIGGYDSDIAFGQRRARVIWRRLMLPGGASVELDELPAADRQGRAGLADAVDVHGGHLLKGVVLSTLLGVGTELGLGGDESELVRAVREATQRGADRAGQQIVGRALDVQPTITVRPGWPLRVLVHRDIVLDPWRG